MNCPVSLSQGKCELIGRTDNMCCMEMQTRIYAGKEKNDNSVALTIT